MKTISKYLLSVSLLFVAAFAIAQPSNDDATTADNLNTDLYQDCASPSGGDFQDATPDPVVAIPPNSIAGEYVDIWYTFHTVGTVQYFDITLPPVSPGVTFDLEFYDASFVIQTGLGITNISSGVVNSVPLDDDTDYYVRIIANGLTLTADFAVSSPISVCSYQACTVTGSGASACSNTTLNLSGQIFDNGPTVAGVWSGGAGSFAGGGVFDPLNGNDYTPGVLDVGATVTFTLTPSSPIGCPATSVDITFFAPPALSGVPASECDGVPVTLGVNDSNPVGGTIDWFASQADMDNGTPIAPPVQTPSVGTTTFFVAKTSNDGCYGTSTTDVEVKALPTASATSGGCGSADATTTDPTPTYLWSTGAVTAGIVGQAAGPYMVTITGANACTNTAQATITCILPVKLLSFTGRINDKVNELLWITGSETNVNRMEVQVSTNGTEFSTLGSRPATNTTTQHSYGFIDAEPAARAYYRLKMIDNDGSFDYSNIVTLVRRNSTLNSMTLYPNPTSGAVKVEYETAGAGEVSFAVTDILGQELYSAKVDAQAGLNVQNLDLSNLPSAVYNVIITKSGSERIVRKIVKE